MYEDPKNERYLVAALLCFGLMLLLLVLSNNAPAGSPQDAPCCAVGQTWGEAGHGLP